MQHFIRPPFMQNLIEDQASQLKTYIPRLGASAI